RHPRLRVAFLESGGGWIAPWVDRMNRHFDDLGFNESAPKTRPSELFQRNCWISFEPVESSIAVLADYIGPHKIMWATDYPHSDDDFVHDGSPARGEALLAWEPRSYMGGFVKVAREHADVELVGIESPLWPRTGTGSRWITTEAYEHFLGRMIAELKPGERWHGVYLALHGAMGVRGVARPEADIARRVREVVGRDAFIAGTFDPHGNEDVEFLRQADFAFCAKYFPHYDSRLQGERAARMLIRAIRGDYTPATATVKVPILTATVLQWTGASPWMDLVQRALVWEAREPDLYM